MKNIFFYQTGIGEIWIAENGKAVTNLYLRGDQIPRANGKLIGYGGGLELKARLLELEKLSTRIVIPRIPSTLLRASPSQYLSGDSGSKLQ